MVVGSWVMFALTKSPAWVGVSAFAGSIPMLLMNPFSGWASDNWDRRRILLVTNGIQAVTAIVMAFAWSSGLSSPWTWLALIAAGGFINGIRLPVWQAFVAECVPKSVLPNAIALNSTQFNAARATGPAIGGLIIGTFGPGWALLAVAVLHLPIAIGLLLIDTDLLISGKSSDKVSGKVLEGYKEAIDYVLDAPGIRTAILSVSFISAFAMPLSQQVVVFAEDVFKVSPFWFGVLSSAQGIGGILVAPMVAATAGRGLRSRIQFGSLLGYGAAIVLFALAPKFWVGFLALLLIGGVHLVSATNLNSVVQLQVDDEVRGRVMALYLMGVLGIMPFANLLMGILISTFGPRPVSAVAGVLLGVAGFFLYSTGRLFHLDE
ncbi:MAG: Uncharacterised protein [Acidimicrobiales bacterium AG-410-I20]|nr:MAG: Uncharacterised protein [Acidimicrobiales bacterium AG-410-I20]